MWCLLEVKEKKKYSRDFNRVLSLITFRNFGKSIRGTCIIVHRALMIKHIHTCAQNPTNYSFYPLFFYLNRIYGGFSGGFDQKCEPHDRQQEYWGIYGRIINADARVVTHECMRMYHACMSNIHCKINTFYIEWVLDAVGFWHTNNEVFERRNNGKKYERVLQLIKSACCLCWTTFVLARQQQTKQQFNHSTDHMSDT